MLTGETCHSRQGFGRRSRLVLAAGGVVALLAAGLLVPVAANPAAAQTPASVDYDVDDDGLIEISSLAHLDAVRWDLDGDGTADVYPPDKDGVTGHDLDGAAKHAAAFAGAVAGMGCPAGGCLGYELIADLDFDTNGSGGADSGDDYWNAGKGWAPLMGGEAIYGWYTGSRYSRFQDQVGRSYFGDRPNPRARMFTGVFEGNGRTIANLYIDDAGRSFVGLFGYIGPGAKVRNFGLTAPNSDSRVRGRFNAGALAGSVERARVGGVYSQIDVTGDSDVGGLVGTNWRYGFIIESYATGDVAAKKHAGGLAGLLNLSGAAASYATGDVTVECFTGGGLAGYRPAGHVRATYATGSVTLTGHDCGTIRVGGLIGRVTYPSEQPWMRASYATGPVSVPQGRSGYGGLTGECDSSGRPRDDGANYWDVDTSGLATSPDCGVGYTTTQLQAPTGYTGIYEGWNVDVNVGAYVNTAVYHGRFDGPGDDPWDFGTSSQYPVLKYCADKPGIQTADGQPYCPLQPDRQRLSSVPRAQSAPVTHGPALDPQLEADVRGYAAETRHGTLHVNRWKRVLEAFGVEDYAGLEPTTLDEARVHVDIGRPRWIPVLAHMAAMDAANPQPPPARGSVQVDAQVLASARAKAGETHRGEKHVNRWKRVLEAFGDGDYPAIEPLTAAGAQVYANVWSGWDEVAAQLRLIEAAAQATGTVVVADDDDAPLPSPEQDGPALDPQLEADVRGYAAETRHGTLHVNRWKRVLEAFGVEDYAGLEPTTLDEARVHVDIGRSRWVPVLAHMAAMDAANPQPPPARGSVQVDAQLLAAARSKAAETHGGARHVNRWKRVLEAFGDGDYPDIEPLTAAGAQVYANVWPAWIEVAAQVRLIEAAATTDPPPVVVQPPVIPAVVVPPPVIPAVVVPPAPEVSIVSSAGGTEGATVTFTLTATPAPAADLDVDVSVATSGDFGYGPVPTTVTIPSGGTATVAIATTDDSTDEPDGTVTLTIDAGSGYTVGAYGSDSVDVTDDDDPVAPVVVVPDPQVSITAGAGVTEGGSATFTVTASPASASGLSVTVTVTQSGAFGAGTGPRTVTVPSGGSVSFAVATSDDSDDEPDGSVTATVDAGSGYTVSNTQGAGTVDVADNDVATPHVRITAGAGVTEGGGATFTVTASPAPLSDLDVTVTVAQSGAFGAGTGQRTVTVPTGGSVSFTVATFDDSADEPDGSVTATVSTGSGYTVSATQGAGTVAVADNDDAPPPSAVTVSVGDASGSEYDWAVDFTVSLSEASGDKVRVWFSTWNWEGLTGRAKIGLDYWTTQRWLVFAPGQTEQTVSVWIIDDSRPEPEEHFTVTLHRPQGATIGRGTATGTITDDD